LRVVIYQVHQGARFPPCDVVTSCCIRQNSCSIRRCGSCSMPKTRYFDEISRLPPLGKSKAGDVITPSLSHECSQQDLPSPIFRGTFWTHGRNNVAGISRNCSTFAGLEFHSCSHSHRWSQRELIAKSHLLLGIVFFKSSDLPKIHGHS